MSVIEGIGDEVLICLIALSILLVIILAWFSTNVTDRPPISIIIIDRQPLQRLIQRITEFTRQRRDSSPTPGTVPTPPGSEAVNQATDVPPAATPADNNENADSSPTSGDAAVNEHVENQDVQSESVASVNENVVEQQPETEEQTNGTTITTQGSVPGAESLSDDQLRQARLSFFEKFGRGSLEGGEQVAEVSSSTEEATADAAGDVPTAEASNDGEIADEDCLDGHIRIRLKYLDDRNRWVQAKPEETIGDFKRRHFEGELSENFVVRFIYNGQELRNPLDTLAKYSIIDKSVIHCLLSRAQPQPDTNAQTPINDFDIGTLMFPLFGIILLLVWYFRFTYRSYFNAMSTFSLIGITLLFIVALLATWRTHDVHEHVE